LKGKKNEMALFGHLITLLIVGTYTFVKLKPIKEQIGPFQLEINGKLKAVTF
jgi:hypothetical protein